MTQLSRTYTITITSGYPSDISEFEATLRRTVNLTNRNKLGVSAMSVHDNAVTLSSLSPREHEVIAVLDLGKSNKEIANALDTTENTVKTHIKSIMNKLRVRKRIQIITTYRALRTEVLINGN